MGIGVVNLFKTCEIKKSLLERSKIDLFLGLVLVLLGQKDNLDVGKDTSLCDGDSRQELDQFFVVSDSELKMARLDSCLLVVSDRVTSQLQDFNGQVLEDYIQVDWYARADSVSIDVPCEVIDEHD